MKRYAFLPIACALLLLGVGCNQAAKETEQTPTAPSSGNQQVSDGTDTERTPVPGGIRPSLKHNNWLTYKGSGGISFLYPPSEEPRQPWDGSDKYPITILDRSLDSAWMELRVITGDGEEGCAPNGTSDTRYINGLLFETCQTIEGAAGSTYRSYRYSTARDERTVHLTFTVRHLTDPGIDERCVDGSVTDNSCEEFNPTRDAEVFRDIIATFLWPDANGINMSDEIIEERTDDLTLSIRYPTLMDATFAGAFNDRLRSDMHALAEEFTGYQNGPLAEQSPGPLSLTLEPTHIYTDGNIVQVLLSGSEYTGGAHPGNVYRNYIYDGENQTYISLFDFFERHDISIESVVEQARNTLEQHPYIGADTDWIKSGTEPKPENYEIGNIEQDRVTIIFPAYQVGPYAAGPQEIVVGL